MSRESIRFPDRQSDTYFEQVLVKVQLESRGAFRLTNDGACSPEPTCRILLRGSHKLSRVFGPQRRRVSSLKEDR